MVNLTIKDLLQEPIKVILIIMGLAASLLMVHISFGMITGTLDESTRSVDEAGYDVYVLQRNRPNIMMGGQVSDEIYEEILSHKAVKKVDRIIDDWTGIKYEGDDIGVGIYGIDVKNSELQPWDIVEGDVEDIEKGNKIIVDQLIWKFNPDLEIGDKVKAGVFEDELEIVGFCKNTQRTGNPVIWTNFKMAKRLLYMENMSTYLGIKLKSDYKIDELEDIVEKYEDEIKSYTPSEVKENINDFLMNDMGMGGSIGILAGIGFLVAMIVISITLYQSVSQKIEELVTLKALGASKGRINRMIIGQTFILVTFGYLISVVMAVIASPYLTSVSSLTVSINPIVAAINYVIALALGVFCSIFSIRKIQHTDPAIIFRS